MTSIVTVVMGFFVICAGVVLLQLSKSAKDVPDTAVFAGDLDQVRTIAEQEQPESEPKADAIRGTAAIVRRLSTARRQMEINEARRLHEEKLKDLQPISENEQYEWDGLRRRRTTYGPHSSLRSGNTTPFTLPRTPQPHPPLGMSHFPEDNESDLDEERPSQLGSLMGTMTSQARSIIVPGHSRPRGGAGEIQSPMHPVALTEMTLPGLKGNDGVDGGAYGLSAGQKTEYEGAAGVGERHITIVDDGGPRRMGSGNSLHPSVGPTPPPHSAKRQFSFQNVFRRSQNTAEGELSQPRAPKHREGFGIRKSSLGTKRATEEETLGLVKGDTVNGRQPTIPDFGDAEDEHDYDYDHDDDDWGAEDKLPYTESPDSEHSEPRRELTPTRREGKEKEKEAEAMSSEEYYDQRRKAWDDAHASGPPPPFKDGKGGPGAFL